MKLSDLKPNPDNPRSIKEEDFEKLKGSIKDLSKMLRLRPIVVDKDNVIVAGNQRYKALLAVGKTEIPDEWVAKADDFTKAELRRFIVQDNVESGDWDYDILSNEYELEELQSWGVDLPGLEEEESQDQGDKVECPTCGSKVSREKIE